MNEEQVEFPNSKEGLKHYQKFIDLAEKMHIGWPDTDKKFMGRDLAYWESKFIADEHLNNHPLRSFESAAFYHRVQAARKKIPWSVNDTVCCLKAVIVEKIMIERAKRGW